MINFLGSVWWLIVTLGLLVTFHEFGHYWVARRCGVKVLRFSIGFGRPLWSRTGRDGTEYWIAMIPLGGYVKMLDAREGEVAAADRDREFTGKSVWQRIAIVAAGPVFNLIFAVVAFWLMFVIGKPDQAPILAAPKAQTLAAVAGVQAGDRLLQVDGRAVGTWSGALDAISEDALMRQPARLDVRRRDGSQRTLSLPLDRLSADAGVGAAFDRIGLNLDLPAVVGGFSDDSPARAAGLRIGDRIVRIGDVAVHGFDDLRAPLQAQAKTSATVTLGIERDGRALSVQVRPVKESLQGTPPRWLIGISPAAQETAVLHYGPVAAFGHALSTTWDKTATTFQLIGRMLTGQASTKNISGVITIARVANASAQRGLSWFIDFLGLVSLSLAVLNLLPIPILDGGHLLYYLIELVKGSPVSERTMIAGQFVGLALLATLIGLALYNDIFGMAS